MLQDVIQRPEHLHPIEGISSRTSPIDAQILDFCDEGELFTETFRNSVVSSCSGGGSGSGIGSRYEDSSFLSTFSPFHSMDPSTLSAFLDSQPPPAEPEHDVSSTVHYSWPQPLLSPSGMSVPTYPSDPHDGFDQIAVAEAGINGYSSDSVVPFMAGSQLLPAAAALPPVLEEICLSGVPTYIGNMDPSTSSLCSFIDPSMNGAFFPGNMNEAVLPGDGQGFFPGGVLVGPEMEVQLQQELAGEYQVESGDVGFYGPLDSRQPVYGCCDGQVLGVHPVGSCSSPTLLCSDTSPLDESTFKVGRLSVEERKEKIHRYMKKRNERNFTKKIKYACRKTLADSRPRVRGRFAKNNDELGECTRQLSGNHDDEDEEVVIKEEEDMVMEPSEIYAHLSGVDSFKCNYTLESWI